MIIPKSEIFSSSFQDVQVQECYVDYINQVAIMGSVMLSMRSELGDTEDESTEMIKVIESVVKESRFLLCGLSVYRDDLVTKLLDSGLQVAFFDYESKDRNILDRVLKSFPRTRIGITVPIDNLDAEIFRLMISQYGTSAHNFLFRYICKYHDSWVFRD